MALKRKSRQEFDARCAEHGTLAASMAARRLQLHLSQADLADLAGVSRGVVIKVESGREVTLEVLVQLMGVLGLHLSVEPGAVSGGFDVSDDLAKAWGSELVGEA